MPSDVFSLAAVCRELPARISLNDTHQIYAKFTSFLGASTPLPKLRTELEVQLPSTVGRPILARHRAATRSHVSSRSVGVSTLTV